MIFAMSGQSQASFAKCYSKLLFVFDWVQRETDLYYRFKMILTCRLLRRQEQHGKWPDIVIVTPTFDDLI